MWRSGSWQVRASELYFLTDLGSAKLFVLLIWLMTYLISLKRRENLNFPARVCRLDVSLCFSPGKAYPPEFYYDTYSPLWQNRPRVYGFKLQWTQMNPNAVDRIVAYRLGIRQVGWLTVIYYSSFDHSLTGFWTATIMAKALGLVVLLSTFFFFLDPFETFCTARQ